MSLEKKLNAKFDKWFNEVRLLMIARAEAMKPDDEWTSLWFDGYTPEEATQGYGESGTYEVER